MEGQLEELSHIIRELFEYGPYALAALFLLYIAPKHTKRFIDCQLTSKKKQNFLLTVAICNWLVAFIMCFYIYNNWSPVVTYQGSLGKHSESSSFITIDPNSYIASHESAGNGDKINWQFAFISSGGTIKQNEAFKFTHEHNDTFNDYEIPVNDLKEGNIKISASPDNPAKLIYHGAQTSSILQPIASYKPEKHPQAFMTAYALSPADNVRIIKKLSSPNSRYQIMGKRKLRTLNKVELRQMLQTPNISSQAERHINSTLNKR
jgi:hypothetical protein